MDVCGGGRGGCGSGGEGGGSVGVCVYMCVGWGVFLGGGNKVADVVARISFS